MEIRDAVRTSVKPLIGVYGESGTGKTYSALLLARGFVGPQGKIILADTESGRGSLYADVIPGGYKVIDVEPPFSPDKAIQLIQLVEKNAAIGIIDSGSHFWEGPGGVCDMADQNEQRTGRPGLHNWREPKTRHQMMMQAFLRSSIPWIICLRAKHKTRQLKRGGKTEIIKEEFTTPIQSDDFIFEMTIHGETLREGHKFNRTKEAHPSLCACFPADGPIEIKHGELLAKWCQGSPSPSSKAPASLNLLKKELWDLTQPKHGGNKDALNQWLWDELILADHKQLEKLSPEELSAVIAKAKEKLK